MNIGFAGLGAIGWPMAAHLARAHRLTVWNRTAARAAEFARAHQAHGVQVARTPRELAAASAAVITCLPTSAEVEALLDDQAGLLTGLAKGSILLDCTSGDPGTSRRIAERLARSGIDFVDAPVSGGTNGAEAGTLTIMVGGSPAAFERARPILASFGRRIEHMGPVGTGHAMKAVNNALLAVNILAVGEGLAALVRAGVEAGKATQVLNASSGRSFVSEALVPERVLTGTWPKTFRLALLEKDVGIATALSESLGVGTPIMDLTRALFRAARGTLGEEADYLEAIKLIEQQAGVELRSG